MKISFQITANLSQMCRLDGRIDARPFSIVTNYDTGEITAHMPYGITRDWNLKEYDAFDGNFKEYLEHKIEKDSDLNRMLT